MQLNPIIEKFYLSILDYAGITIRDNIFVNKNEKVGEITIDGKYLTLPYFDNLKNPGDKIIFHPLNENYTNPETSVFNIYKRRLVLELNLRLSSLIVSLISVGSNVELQQKIKSSKLIEMISNIGEVDYPLIETFLSMSVASKKVNEEAYLFDIFLKKNGEINDVPYAAIGKINFLIYNEIIKAIQDKEHNKKVFGFKFPSKKYLMALENILRAIFPSIDRPENYMEGTDNKIFRYLNILLLTSYQISHRINEIADLLEELNEPSLNLEEIRSNLEWAQYLEQLYGMANEIRLIPSQTDISIESNKLKLDESKASTATPTISQTPPQFDPSRIQSTQQVQSQPVYPQTNQQHQLTPEEIIRNSLGPVPPTPMTNLGTMVPIQQPLQQVYTPSWIMQEQIRSGQVLQPQMQQVITPQGMMMVPIQQPQMQQVMPNQFMPNQGPVVIPVQSTEQNTPVAVPVYNKDQGSSLQINPHFMYGNRAPWS